MDGKVVLAWQAVPNASQYTVYRGTTENTVTTAVGQPTGTTFTNTGLASGTTYFYDVRATVSGLLQAASALVEATPRALSCSSGNGIVVENCFPGSTQWKLTAPADAAAGGIEGFAGATSVNAGASVPLQVNTTAGAPYHVEIYRTGYYGGSQGRLISVIPSLVGVAQPDCNSSFSTGVVDCSNWAQTSIVTTTGAWQSGIYVLRLVRDDNHTDNEILLVVRRADTSDLIYTVPVTSYQAYNNYGGRSLYDWNSWGSNTIAGTPRAVKVSFDRPYEEPVQDSRNWYTTSDIQNVSWLEQQGYSITYATSLDLQTGAVHLAGHKGYISPSHDEYWSSQMRSAVSNGLAAGVSLLYLGSNADYWKIRFEASAYSGTANRVEVCYKTTQGGPVDPSGPTGTWRDPNGANQPENALIGQMYVGDNDNVFFPLQVTAAQGQNRVWRYTSLASMAPGTTSSLGSNLVGWEWDARVNNGAEPAGVTPFASTPVTGELLTDAGKTYTNGSTTTMATEYRTGNGAWVFATGTNHWSRGLGYNTDGVGEPNSFVQQATTNVLGDMHARPTTPSSGLTADATGAPAVTGTTPTTGATGVPTITTVTARFDKPIDPATIKPQSFTLSDPAGQPAPAAVGFDAATNTATLTPQAPLHSGTTYTATLSTTITTWAGTPLAAAVTITFTTQPVTVTTTLPAAGATNVGSAAAVTATFSAPLDPTTVNVQTFTLATGGNNVAGTVTYAAGSSSATFTPTTPLSSGATYTATLTTGIHGADGSPLPAAVAWSFTVANCPCSLLGALVPQAVDLSVQDGRSGTGPFSYELGTKIQVTSPVRLTAIRFYKDSLETGSHVGRVWDAGGQVLAQTTFTAETASGWQEQVLTTPLTLRPGSTYVVSVGFNSYFVVTPAGLATQITSGPLATVADGHNGVFASQAGAFPTQSWNSTDYFVDVIVR